MSFKVRKFIAFLICFLFIFEQSGFAQVAGELDISAYIAGLRNSFIQDKFRPLHLRYLSYDSLNNNFKLLLDKGDFMKGLSPKGTVPEQNLKETTKVLLNYFFIGITLPNSSFWVNLRPDSENEIIDSELAKTDVGRILLEADLQLKKDTAKATSPETPEGKAYWDKLYQKAGELFGSENITIPTLTRPWIVPGEIIIRETPENAYIYKATLKVMLEQDYLKNSAVYNFKDERLKQLNEYSSQLIREKILPKLTKEINTSKRYSALRQVYYSLILSQWFKQRFYGKGGLYSWLIDKKNLNGLTSKQAWSKTTYFKEYQKSFKEGEYNLKVPISTPFGQTIRSYMSGGIGFNNLGIPQISSSPLKSGETFTNPDKNVLVVFTERKNPLLVRNKKAIQLAIKGSDNPANPFGVLVNVNIEEASSPSGSPARGLQSDAYSVIIPADPGNQDATSSLEAPVAAVRGITIPAGTKQQTQGGFINLGGVVDWLRSLFRRGSKAESQSALPAAAQGVPPTTMRPVSFHDMTTPMGQRKNPELDYRPADINTLEQEFATKSAMLDVVQKAATTPPFERSMAEYRALHEEVFNLSSKLRGMKWEVLNGIPIVKEGYTRLYRGADKFGNDNLTFEEWKKNSKVSDFASAGEWFSSKFSIADAYAHMSKFADGLIVYMDVPNSEIDKYSLGKSGDYGGPTGFEFETYEYRVPKDDQIKLGGLKGPYPPTAFAKTEEASLPSGLPAGGLQSGASSAMEDKQETSEGWSKTSFINRLNNIQNKVASGNLKEILETREDLDMLKREIEHLVENLEIIEGESDLIVILRLRDIKYIKYEDVIPYSQFVLDGIKTLSDRIEEKISYLLPNDILAGLTPDNTIAERARLVESGVLTPDGSRIAAAGGMWDIPVTSENIHPIVFYAVVKMNNITGVKTKGSGPDEMYGDITGETAIVDKIKSEMESAIKGLPIAIRYPVAGENFDYAQNKFRLSLSGNVKLKEAKSYWDKFANRLNAGLPTLTTTPSQAVQVKEIRDGSNNLPDKQSISAGSPLKKEESTSSAVRDRTQKEGASLDKKTASSSLAADEDFLQKNKSGKKLFLKIVKKVLSSEQGKRVASDMLEAHEQFSRVSNATNYERESDGMRKLYSLFADEIGEGRKIKKEFKKILDLIKKELSLDDSIVDELQKETTVVMIPTFFCKELRKEYNYYAINSELETLKELLKKITEGGLTYEEIDELKRPLSTNWIYILFNKVLDIGDKIGVLGTQDLEKISERIVPQIKEIIPKLEENLPLPFVVAMANAMIFVSSFYEPQNKRIVIVADEENAPLDRHIAAETGHALFYQFLLDKRIAKGKLVASANVEGTFPTGIVFIDEGVSEAYDDIVRLLVATIKSRNEWLKQDLLNTEERAKMVKELIVKERILWERHNELAPLYNQGDEKAIHELEQLHKDALELKNYALNSLGEHFIGNGIIGILLEENGRDIRKVAKMLFSPDLFNEHSFSSPNTFLKTFPSLSRTVFPVSPLTENRTISLVVENNPPFSSSPISHEARFFSYIITELRNRGRFADENIEYKIVSLIAVILNLSDDEAKGKSETKLFTEIIFDTNEESLTGHISNYKVLYPDTITKFKTITDNKEYILGRFVNFQGKEKRVIDTVLERMERLVKRVTATSPKKTESASLAMGYTKEEAQGKVPGPNVAPTEDIGEISTDNGDKLYMRKGRKGDIISVAFYNQDGKQVGFVDILLNDSLINYIYVDPEFRSHNYSKVFLDTILKKLEDISFTGREFTFVKVYVHNPLIVNSLLERGFIRNPYPTPVERKLMTEVVIPKNRQIQGAIPLYTEDETKRKTLRDVLGGEGFEIVEQPIQEGKTDTVAINVKYTRYFSDGSASSPSTPVTKQDKGGVDFRALPAVTQPMGMPTIQGQSPKNNHPLDLSGTVPVSMNLDAEWRQMENMIQAGIIPSSQRIKEYLQASCQNGNFSEELDRVLSGIVDILRLEEERVFSTEAALKELLVLLESDKSAQELQVALGKITVLPKEPKRIDTP